MSSVDGLSSPTKKAAQNRFNPERRSNNLPRATGPSLYDDRYDGTINNKQSNQESVIGNKWGLNVAMSRNNIHIVHNIGDPVYSALRNDGRALSDMAKWLSDIDRSNRAQGKELDLKHREQIMQESKTAYLAIPETTRIRLAMYVKLGNIKYRDDKENIRDLGLPELYGLIESSWRSRHEHPDIGQNKYINNEKVLSGFLLIVYERACQQASESSDLVLSKNIVEAYLKRSLYEYANGRRSCCTVC